MTTPNRLRLVKTMEDEGCTSSKPARQLAEQSSEKMDSGPDSTRTSPARAASVSLSDGSEDRTVSQLVTRRERMDMLARSIQAKLYHNPISVEVCCAGSDDEPEGERRKRYTYPVRPPGWTQALE